MDLRSIELAHDMKMPIQLIYSCVQLLEMELAPNERTEGYLKMLVRSADQLQSMVRNALDSAGRASGGDEALRIAPRDVVAQARDVSRQCALFAREKGVDVRFHANASEFKMPMDGEKLDRILHNLLSNALRYTPEGGRVEVSALVRGDAVDFVVADSGCGIPFKRQARVFELGESDAGSGYGLAIVREYTELLGGSVQLESCPGRGSRFTVHLPVRTAQGRAV